MSVITPPNQSVHPTGQGRERTASLLTVRDLTVRYASTHEMAAVDGASFSIGRGERIALVGESGSGKTTLSLAVAGFLRPPEVQVTASELRFDGEAVDLRERTILPHVRPGMAMTFQDAMTSLDPVWTIGSQLTAVIRARTGAGRREARVRARGWLQRVGLTDTERVLAARPHELSGGMRQRAMMAIALSGQPRMLIADEPTSALDAPLARSTMKLLSDLTAVADITLLTVTHDIHLGLQYSDRTFVMYRGRIVEQLSSARAAADATHPYTRGLLACVPTLQHAGHDRLPTLADFVTPPEAVKSR